MRKTGNLDSPALKNFAQTTEQMAELDRLYNVLGSNKAIGMSTADTEKQIKEIDEIGQWLVSRALVQWKFFTLRAPAEANM